ncbi:hypothetical protein [Kurthia sibirica]|uniref:Uncharacterized protein n=1 Tax=Kurthia sibirica TaxID=202750 RepID=A0A2U3ANF1_9BACL|nr:hypothetical protein [Kurthia sibirica]PWI26058.1 hypothetical protein DEX24_05885 [Kurthia sibirica]GEK34791.1 hypothetical protein KSI01_23240 [Kurthia sibirica]
MNLTDFLSQVQIITKGKYGVNDLLSDDFLSRHTPFDSAEVLFKSLPFDVDEKLIEGEFSESELNEFINRNTQFDSWKDLLIAATNYLSNE